MRSEPGIGVSNIVNAVVDCMESVQTLTEILHCGVENNSTQIGSGTKKEQYTAWSAHTTMVSFTARREQCKYQIVPAYAPRQEYINQSVHIRSETAQFVHYVTLMRSAKPRLAYSSNFHVS